jgi:hypothetical protein
MKLNPLDTIKRVPATKQTKQSTKVNDLLEVMKWHGRQKTTVMFFIDVLLPKKCSQVRTN